MSSPRKGGLKGGFQLEPDTAGRNRQNTAPGYFSPSPNARKQKTDFHAARFSSSTPSNNSASAEKCISDVLKAQFQSDAATTSSLDQISSDVQRILQDSIDFVPARNSQNALLVNVQKKCVNLSDIKLVAFASSGALPVRTPSLNMVGADGNLQQNGGFGKMAAGSSQQTAQSSQKQNASPSKSGSDDQLPEPKRSFYDEDKICLEWTRPNRVGSGLRNAGNTCFLNATLQCLAYTPALYNYLMTDNHKKTCPVNGFCIICQLETTVRLMFQSCSTVSPNGLIGNIKQFAKSLSIGRQEDAHEFLRFVIEAMRKSALTGQNLKMVDMYSQETTIASRLFGGFYRSRVTCLSCKHRSNVYDPFMDVPLDVGKNVSSLEDALQNFIRPENLSSPNNLYNCEQCKKMCAATKQVTVHKPPNILTIQLKRFLFNSFSTFSKIDKPITYPEYLDFRPYISREVQPTSLNYRLYGVLVHWGSSCHSGHYFSYIRASNNNWHRMDDCTVHPVNKNQALSQKAYLLFYSRIPDQSSNRMNPPVNRTALPVVPGPSKLNVSTPLKSYDVKDGRLKPPFSFQFINHPKSVSTTVPAKPSVTGNGPAASPAPRIIGPTLISEKPKAPAFQPRILMNKSAVKLPVQPNANGKPLSLVPYGSDEDDEEKAAVATPSVPPLSEEVDLKNEPEIAKSDPVMPVNGNDEIFKDEKPSADSSEIPVAAGTDSARVVEVPLIPSVTLENQLSTPDESFPVDLLSSPSKKEKKSQRSSETRSSPEKAKNSAVEAEKSSMSENVPENGAKKKKRKKRKNKRKHADSPASSCSSSSSGASIPPVEWIEKTPEPVVLSTGSVVNCEPQSEPVRFSPLKNVKDQSVYGSEVRSWSGEKALLEKEEEFARNQKRKQMFQEDDDWDTPEKRKKNKHCDQYNSFRRSGSGKNEFQRFQNSANYSRKSSY